MKREYPVFLAENRSAAHLLNYVLLVLLFWQAWRSRASEFAFVLWGSLAFALLLDLLQRALTVYTLDEGVLRVRQAWRGASIPVAEIWEIRSCPGGRNLPKGPKLRAAITTSNLLAIRWGPKDEEHWVIMSPSEELVRLIRRAKKKK
ncbi:MAG: hypothetical protein PWP12_593 [Bacillota bacterium]|nr:hypothetical protein [Bacillota bacterium]MDK2881836.1 hypothetical protein [Bacillota bacterium]MDK2960409.1 hypothetical protein [Bacillota bacterium]